jgi:excisionase family DNA binding protein
MARATGNTETQLRIFFCGGLMIMETVQISSTREMVLRYSKANQLEARSRVETSARLLGASRSLVYAYVERKQIPHFRMMGRSIRFSLSELEKWRRQFFVNGGING